MSYPILLSAIGVGELALQGFRQCARGRVIAKFERSLYVRFESGAFVGIGTQSIGVGPLNVLLVQRDWLRLRNVSLMQAVEAGDGGLALGAQRIVLDGGARWHPGRALMRREQFSMRLRALTARAERRVPTAGLGRLAFSADVSDADPVLHLARPAWDALGRWLAHAVTNTEAAHEPEPVAATLIGLGPGLTPSGDDVFCGVLIALKLLGLDHAARVLWSWLLAHLDERTSELSAAHLRAAAMGQGHGALHAVLECGADDEGALDAALCRLGRIGHCSGWDALAGIALVWRALAAQEVMRRVASSAAWAFEGATVTPARSSVRRCAE